MPDLNAAMEDYLASLPEDDWQALTARVRPPEATPSETTDTPAKQFAQILSRQLKGTNHE